MPSPVATIRPTSVATRLASKAFRRSLMTSEISLVLMPTLFLYLLRGVRQAAAQLLQSVGKAGVDEVIAVLQFEPADDAAVDCRGKAHLFAESGRQLLADAIAVIRRELDSGSHGCPHATCRVVREVLVFLDDAGDLIDAASLDEHPGQVGGLGIEEFRCGNQLQPPCGGNRGVRHDMLHGGIADEV